MKLDDILALEDDDSIQYVSPTTSGSLTVKAGSTNTSATVMGVLPAYAKIVNQGVQSGRYIIDADVDNRSAVCVIGPDLAEDLFGNTNVVGNTLHIDGRKFKIVGVLESKGTSMGGSSDDSLILPFTLAQLHARFDDDLLDLYLRRRFRQRGRGAGGCRKLPL